MPTVVSLLGTFQANFPGLTQLLTMPTDLIGVVAGVSAVVMMQGRMRFDGQAPITTSLDPSDVVKHSLIWMEKLLSTVLVAGGS